jgi:SulP family sulfate permease
MITGIITYLVGMAKGGNLVNFLGPSVLNGFLTGASLVIFVTQFKYILGIKVPSSVLYMHEKVILLLVNLPKTNVYDVVIGVISFLFLYGVKHVRQTFKPTKERMEQRWFRWLYVLSNAASFFALILGAVACYVIAAGMPDGKPPLQIVGSIPAGILAPNFHLYTDFNMLLRLVPSGCAIGLISFTGNWAVSKRYAVINGYEVDANQEMMAAGLSSIIGVLLNSFAVSGGLSRSAVNAESGAVTLVSTLIAAVLMILALLFFTQLFYYIPMCCLGAVIQISVLSMMDFQKMQQAYKQDKKDFVVIVATFLITFFVGILEGITAGVFISVAFVIKSSAFPEISILGQVPGTPYYRNIAKNPDCVQIPGAAATRASIILPLILQGLYQSTRRLPTPLLTHLRTFPSYLRPFFSLLPSLFSSHFSSPHQPPN